MAEQLQIKCCSNNYNLLITDYIARFQMINDSLSIIKKYKLLIPIALYLLMCAFFWITGPVHYGGDSNRYIEGAHNLIAGKQVDNSVTHFIGYVFFVAGLYKLNLGDSGVVLAQIIIVGVSIFALYDLAQKYKNKNVAFIALCLLVINLEIHKCSFYILTEAVFISFVIFSLWAFYRTITSKKNSYWIFLSGGIFVFLASLRPHGWLISFCLTAFLIFAFLKSTKFWSVGLIIALSILLIFIVFWMPQNLNIVSARPAELISQGYYADQIINSLTNGEIVWHTAEMRIQMPAPDEVVGEGLRGVVDYCANNFLACSKLVLRRIIAQFVYMRPYYSLYHNLVILLTMTPVYLFAVLGFFKSQKDIFAWSFLLVFLLFVCFVGITYLDYNGRFSIYLFPIVILFGAIGAENIFERIRMMRKSSAIRS